jgi:hypothetical protein
VSKNDWTKPLTLDGVTFTPVEPEATSECPKRIYSSGYAFSSHTCGRKVVTVISGAHRQDDGPRCAVHAAAVLRRVENDLFLTMEARRRKEATAARDSRDKAAQDRVRAHGIDPGSPRVFPTWDPGGRLARPSGGRRPMTQPKRFNTREEWLTAAAEILSDWIANETDLNPSNRVLISCGWPRRDRNGKVIGQCFKKEVGVGVHHLFISPTLTDRVAVLDTLLHELVHAADNCKHGHKGPFVKAIRALGIEGKPTSGSAGKELRKRLSALAKELGPYPHTLLSASSVKTQSTRMLKVKCPDSDYCIRMTRKWIEEVGTPICPCHGLAMEEA